MPTKKVKQLTVTDTTDTGADTGTGMAIARNTETEREREREGEGETETRASVLHMKGLQREAYRIHSTPAQQRQDKTRPLVAIDGQVMTSSERSDGSMNV